MNGAKEVNMGVDSVVLEIKETSKSQLKETEDEHVSNVYNANSTHKNDNDKGLALPMQTVHANKSMKVPPGRQAKPIKELIDIAHKTNQTSKIMSFSPIDYNYTIL